MKRIGKIIPVIVMAIAMMVGLTGTPASAGYTSKTYNGGGCTFFLSVGNSTSYQAHSQSYAFKGDSECKASRVKLGYRDNKGVNRVTLYSYDTSSSGHYNANAAAAARGTPRYAKGGVKNHEGYWYGATVWR